MRGDRGVRFGGLGSCSKAWCRVTSDWGTGVRAGGWRGGGG